MNNNVINIWKQLTDSSLKKECIKTISNEFELAESSVHSNYLTKGQIPKSKEKRIIEILQNAYMAQLQIDKIYRDNNITLKK